MKESSPTRGALLLLLLAACSSTSEERRAGGPVFYQEAVWTPDGATLLLSRHERERYRLVLIRSDGRELEELTDGDDLWSSWSPSGSRFVFHSDRDGNGEIYVARRDGTILDNLTRCPSDETTPAWSPDGFKIAFASNREGRYQIHMMDAQGFGQVRVSDGPGVEFNPTWSPDGRYIAFFSNEQGADWIVVMRADGTKRTRIALGVFPSWSPDGRRILYDRSNTVYAIAPQGGAETVVLADAWAPRCSPDGKRLSFIRGEWPASEVWIANVDGSGAKRLTPKR